MERTSTDAPAFEAMYRESAARVFAYALRHSDDATAQDVVSETFLTAWRRRDVLPDEPLPWLLVVARNTLANRHRSERHQERLVDAASVLGQVAAAAADADVLERQNVLAALADLSPREREALLLVAWDGLHNAQAAQVANCSQRAFEVRLSRARARLTRSLSAPAIDRAPNPDPIRSPREATS